MIIKSFPQSVGDGHTKLIQAETQGQKMAHAQSADAREKMQKHETYLHAQIQPSEHKRRRKATNERSFSRRFAVPVPK